MAKAIENVNVRMTPEMYDYVSSVARKYKASRSEVIRLAINGELAGMVSKDRYTEEQFVTILEKTNQTISKLLDVEVQVSRIGNNVNQIAKRLNTNKTETATMKELEEVKKTLEEIKKRLVGMGDEVSEWGR